MREEGREKKCNQQKTRLVRLNGGHDLVQRHTRARLHKDLLQRALGDAIPHLWHIDDARSEMTAT